MKICGIILRVLAILVVCVLCVTTIAEYAIYTQELKEAREELEEDIEKHNEDIDEDHDSDCYECESFEDREKSYDRSSSRKIIGNIQNVILYLIYGGILFALGAIVSAKGKKKESEAVCVQAQAPVATEICPTCGTALRAGAHFCGRCGTVIGN